MSEPKKWIWPKPMTPEQMVQAVIEDAGYTKRDLKRPAVKEHLRNVLRIEEEAQKDTSFSPHTR